MMAPKASAVLKPAFSDPVTAAQACFRGLLDAMAHPGTFRDIAVEIDGPPGVDAATAALLLSLLDHETRLWLELGVRTEGAREFFAFHCGSLGASSPALASFAVVDGTVSLGSFNAGTAERPDQSATVFVQVPGLEKGEPVRLSGPGIENHRTIAPGGLDRDFWRFIQLNAALFPRGVDLVLVAGKRFCALPRTTRVEV